jgi:hypothetical protein
VEIDKNCPMHHFYIPDIDENCPMHHFYLSQFELMTIEFGFDTTTTYYFSKPFNRSQTHLVIAIISRRRLKEAPKSSR